MTEKSAGDQRQKLSPEMAEWFRPYAERPELLHGFMPVMCPPHLCRCKAPNCALIQSTEFHEAIQKLEAQIHQGE